jgi:hypothetical protein
LTVKPKEKKNTTENKANDIKELFNAIDGVAKEIKKDDSR